VQSTSGKSVGIRPHLAVRVRHAPACIGAALILGISAATALATAASSSSTAERATVQHQSPARTEPNRAVDADAVAPVRRFSGFIGQDLSRALMRAGVPESQGREYVALLARAIPLANGLSVGDRFDLVLQRNPDGSLGQLLYAGLDRVARADVELMKWTDGKRIIWVNADGVGGDGSQAMRMPVPGRMTSGFGERFHPILGFVRFHDGVDLAAAWGTPIVAAADGRVISAGWNGGYGRAVVIAHADGLETKYGHMSRIAAYLGESVSRGEVIGYVGSSGLSTGPHLHFEVLRNGRPVNPASVGSVAGGPGRLEGEKLVNFHEQLRRILLG
jgi:murein DD-endopeptidase MepM/ murein hydrolase activator NlpD